MQIFKTKINEVLLFLPDIFQDDRGYFFESYSHSKYCALCEMTDFIQDNESHSTYGTLRGLHYQLPPNDQAKLVRVVQGKVFDVAVDIRQSSPTFRQYVLAELSEKNKHQLFIPRGFAHGFLVLSDHCIFAYKVDNRYEKKSEQSIRWNDPHLNIPWGMPEKDIILSSKDKIAPFLSDAIIFP